ncbi:MAG: CvpA family protein [Candidatus Latescibacteria bacterium]|nr:CvpA family protein [Candidatus Latescibacterota bacterium]
MSDFVLNLLCLGCVVWMVVRGWQSGLIRSVAGLLGIAVGVWVATRYGLRIDSYLQELLPISDRVVSSLSFVVAIALGVFALRLGGNFLYSVLQATPFGLLDTVGGATAGFIKSLIVIGLLTLALRVIPLPAEWNNAARDSTAMEISGSAWGSVVETVEPYLPTQAQLYVKELREKAERKWSDAQEMMDELPDLDDIPLLPDIPDPPEYD